ncbi:MAG TPA: PEGA domain-containing protein [Kofleriaceae bacterium]|nr:PEGA domain-containing protein [Kofleriaceae bacterium]
MGWIARLAAVIVACVAVTAAAGPEPGDGSGNGSDIEMDAGSGSGSQPPTPAQPDPVAAKRWLAAAQILVQKGDYWTHANKPDEAKAEYQNAVTAYHKAIDAGEDVSTYLALAQVEDKLGDLADAYAHAKRVIDAQPPVKPDVLKKAQAKLDDLGNRVGIVTLAIKPDGVAVALGNQQVGTSPLAQPIVLAPGSYTLSLSAVGYQPKDLEIKVDAGSESDRKIELQPVPVVVKNVAPAPPPLPPPPPPGPPPDKLPLYIGAGATGALALTATISGIVALHDHGVFTGAGTSPSARYDAQVNGRTAAHVADACWLGALAGAGFTAYWYVFKYMPAERASKEPPATAVLPWARPGAGGLAVGGSF